MKECPVYEKILLTLQEASAVSGIGINKLRTITDEPDCPFVVWNSNKRMIKRAKLEDFLLDAYSI